MTSWWHGVDTGLTAAEFRKWRWWMLSNQAGLYFAWARALTRQELNKQ